MTITELTCCGRWHAKQVGNYSYIERKKERERKSVLKSSPSGLDVFH